MKPHPDTYPMQEFQLPGGRPWLRLAGDGVPALQTLAPAPAATPQSAAGPAPPASPTDKQATTRQQPSPPPSHPSALADRNRRNARRSTGPRSEGGKAVARLNALKHGLTANPAIAGLEDAAAFTQLHTELVHRYRPVCPVEAALVHRMAVALWRLQRATTAETALLTVSCLAEARAATHTEVQRWIEQINSAWKPTPIEIAQTGYEPDPRQDGHRTRTAWQRLALAGLDELREGEMSASGAALEAMATMLESLTQRLEQTPGAFGCEDAEKMAWLLGDFAGYFPVELDGRFQDRGQAPACTSRWPGSAPSSPAADPRQLLPLTPTAQLIASAMDRPPAAPLPAALVNQITSKLETLRHQSAACPRPLTGAQLRRRVAGAALPDAAAMERLLRYEAHAERSLARALGELERRATMRRPPSA